MVIYYLKYGFPVEFPGDANDFQKVKLWKNRNNKGEKSYLGKEKSSDSIIGLFKSNPFNDSLKISPLNSVPKKS